MDRYEFGKLRKRLLEECNRCELCGGRRNLEVHHIIPKSCENDYIDLDIEDNLIVLCGRCHAMLTPRSVLCKYGISRTKERNERIKESYKTVGWRVEKFYEELLAISEAGENISHCETLDIFDKWFMDA